ncbi:hydroxymethylglutaryl-CoA lyase [Ramlibacter tataouinensis]|uniref:hydroxymethylglutaryl-CoA lyase n=1 Tax=Ramlibacter tataouinensis TaxID=94132 RepID=UPI0022F3F1D8|nr:hydroxymethylglutaryl-CoA lyase [Ramlibacter tataouinensis]WBY03580.1 hydroxymethylglutaryl-CoA lyase [Ramlibacter tataouinensis]
MTNFPRRIEIREEGPREGFQIEPPGFTVAQRAELVEALAGTGLRQIQVASFVNPARVPQMADAPELFRAIRKRPGVRYTALWLNANGFQRAASVPEVDLEGSLYFYATDAFCRMNNNASAEAHAEAQREWVQRYHERGLPVETAYLMTAFGCNFEGEVPLPRLRQALQQMARVQDETSVRLQRVVLADTVGWANPESVRERVGLAREMFPDARIGLHLHDTRGLGLANAYAALKEGVDLFDSSVAGLGGCPFSGHVDHAAAGNICTEDLVFLCHELNIETGVDLERLVEAARLAQRIIGRRLNGRLMHSGSLAALRAAKNGSPTQETP